MTLNEHRAKIKKALPRRGAPRKEAAPLDDNGQIVGQTDIFNDIPVLPYAGTSGWSGSDTSRARAIDADRDGTTTDRQMRTIRLLSDSGVAGLTWREMSDISGEHHGQVSGALSVLHKEGKIARLSESRLRCKVYVLLENVNGRETEPHGRKTRDSNTDPVPPTPAAHPPVIDGNTALVDDSDKYAVRSVCRACGVHNGLHKFPCQEWKR